MATLTLPFPVETNGNNHEEDLLNSNLYKELPPLVQEVAAANPHLLEYLHMVPISETGMPLYCPNLSRKLGDEKRPNFIYPSNRKGVFIHILFNANDSRNSYIPIEPTLTRDLSTLMGRVDMKLLQLRRKLPHIATTDSAEEKERKILDFLLQVTILRDQQAPGLVAKCVQYVLKGSGPVDKLRMTTRELEGIKYLFLRDRMGLGVLEALISDPYIEDISCSGLGQVFIEHKIFKSLKSSVTFATAEELDQFVLWMAERIRKPVNYRVPIVDATLPDGSRINIVYGKEVARRGSNFSIRKFAGVPTSIFELVDFATINYQILAYLSLVVGNGMSLFVSGETASGKTTMLNALTTFIHPSAKVVSIEDTPELQVPHKNWIREVVQTTKVDDKSGAVNMFDLLKAALRQRPNEILVGEIRGPEGNVAFQAMQTGHSVMATFHAASVEKLIQRITGDPISVPKTYIDNLNVVILMSMVKLPSGKMGRRVTGINEIVGYDPSLDSFTFVESFHWDEVKDTFEFTGYMTSYILEYKIAPKLGIPSNKKQRVYAELERRAKILERIHRDQGITDFYEILQVLGKAQREGLF
jgi:flagellar protein FlaI